MPATSTSGNEDRVSAASRTAAPAAATAIRIGNRLFLIGLGSSLSTADAAARTDQDSSWRLLGGPGTFVIKLRKNPDDGSSLMEVAPHPPARSTGVRWRILALVFVASF